MRIQHRLDFAQLDPESAQFDLMINAPQALDRSVWPPPRQIARAIQPGRTIHRDKGVGYEFFCRQLRAVEIAPCQAVAAQVQFARRADGHWLQVRIKDVRLSISQRFADADRAVGAGYLATGGPDGGLGRTVKVPEARPFGEQPRRQFTRQWFARANHLELRTAWPTRIEQHLPRHWCGLQESGLA